ncbi:MAG: hypothetical protein PHV30_04930 [Candidatus Margulisbacteria bacterium]|nr:hypothetical protein [Candidatus Margulisiibacteriota bacterium]
MTNNYIFLIFFIGTYSVYIIAAVLLKTGRGKSPLKQFNLLHFKFFTLYLVISSLYCLLNLNKFSLIILFDFLIGVFFYFAFHYAIFMNFVSLVAASVSTSILSLVYENKNHIHKDKIAELYAGGEGIEYIRTSRIRRINDMLGWIDVKNNTYKLTDKGRRMVYMTKLLLKVWKLKQLGFEK